MYQPLADEIRPKNLDEVVGQEHILGKGKMCVESLSLEKFQI